MLLRVYIDCWRFKVKPTKKEIPHIRKRMREQKLTIWELHKALENGQTVQPALLDAHGRFRSQQVFLVDVDGGRTPEKSMEVCRQTNIIPAMMYFTFSSTADDPRHRLVFLLDKPIEDAAQRDALQKALTQLFGGDPKTNDRKRLFFGGTRVFNCMGGTILPSKIKALLEGKGGVSV